VGNGAPALPGSVIIETSSQAVYVQGVNGRTNLPIEVFVLDGGGTPVPDPAPGVNNVRLEIVGGAQGGERLGAVSASGANQQGASVVARTGNGVANAIYTSGTRSGVLTLRATSDRADNNVDNGIQDPVVSTRQITVSDGRLFEVEIAGGPLQGATNANTTFNDGTGIYTTVVSVNTTDRNSQPPAPGTVIRWGLVDEPQVGGNFVISGTNGDPQENGTLFTAVGGRFDLAQPGDTLLIIADEPSAGTPDNRDLEGARRIAQIQSSTTLTVTERFNNNENSQGVSVNNGPVLDYVIGHPADANIVGARRVLVTDPDTGEVFVNYVSTGSAESTTDEFGRAYALITYSRTALGKAFYLWAQGNGDLVNGTPEQIGDVELTQLQGEGPTTITVFPGSIFPNRNETIQVCVRDAGGIGVPGQTITYSFSVTGGGDIISPAGSTGGVINGTTGANGCIAVTVRANSLGTGGEIVFAVLGDPEATGTVEIESPGAVGITAAPNPVPLTPNDPGQLTALTTICALTESGGVQNQPVQLQSCTAPPPVAGTEFAAFPGTPTGPDGCTQVGAQYTNVPNNYAVTCVYSVGATGTVSVTFRAPPP
ncbi:MAG TPA: hypothetical protein VFL14_09630, partial [Xanthomonadales bacterium]|nr:hypothetical protein [Xanthomonadales bacterium]